MTLIEVKSSHGPKPHHITDIAIQRYVLEMCGLNLSSVEVAHVNGDFIYRKNDDYQGLLVFVDVWDQVNGLTNEVPNWIQSAKQILGKRKPRIPTEVNCNSPYSCPFTSECFVETDENTHPIGDLYYKGKIVKELIDEPKFLSWTGRSVRAGVCRARHDDAQ